MHLLHLPPTLPLPSLSPSPFPLSHPPPSFSLTLHSQFDDARHERCLQQQFLYGSTKGLIEGSGCSAHSLLDVVQPREVGLHVPQTVSGGGVVCSATPAGIVHTGGGEGGEGREERGERRGEGGEGREERGGRRGREERGGRRGEGGEGREERGGRRGREERGGRRGREERGEGRGGRRGEEGRGEEGRGEGREGREARGGR